MNKVILIFISTLLFSSVGCFGFWGKAGKYSVRALDEVIEIAAKVSGRSIGKAARKRLIRQLSKMAVKHGDDALRAAERGGLELIEASAKHGDDVLRFSKAVPCATRALALHADELVPLTRRLGMDVLRLEAKSSGIANHVVRNFGDDAVKVFAEKVPSRDITRLVGYAEHADSPKTRMLLLKAYGKTGGKILEKLDWKVIMATGLTASMIIGTHEVADGVQTGLITVSKNSPETFGTTVNYLASKLLFPYQILLGGLALVLVLAFGFRMRRFFVAQHAAAETCETNRHPSEK